MDVADATSGAALSEEVRAELRSPVADEGSLLSISDLSVRYGTVAAVSKVDLEVRPGEILGVIGGNGAGKTSLIDSVTGFASVHSGQVLLRGRAIQKWSPTRRAQAGLGRTFQNLELFEDLTVTENILVSTQSRRGLSCLTDLAVPAKRKASAIVAATVELMGLQDVVDKLVCDLPQGTRRLVAIARAVAQRPMLICFDEPAAGLGEAERAVLSRVFRVLAKDLGVGLLIVEHNIDVIVEVCDNIVAMDFGQVIARGTAHTVLTDEAVRSAYLGVLGSVTPNEPEPLLRDVAATS